MNKFIVLLSILTAILFIYIVTPLVPYSFFKILKLHRTGIIISLVTLISLISITYYITNEDKFYSKKSIKKDLEFIGVNLEDDFEILKNESGGLRDYYHIFKLKINSKDKKRLLDKFPIISERYNKNLIIKKEDTENTIDWTVNLSKKKNILIYEHVIP